MSFSDSSYVFDSSAETCSRSRGQFMNRVHNGQNKYWVPAKFLENLII